MSTLSPRLDAPRPATRTPAEASPRDEAIIDLEYHALMGVAGGDQPAHVQAFVRSVTEPSTRPHPARSKPIV